MEQDIYRKLMKHLGNVGIGYPQIDDFLEVLKRSLTPEEAEIATGLPTRRPPFEVEEVDMIAHRVQKPFSEVEEILPSGDKMKKAIRWISDTLLEHPEKKRKQIIREAELRFDLTPLECEFLNRNFDDLACEKKGQD